MQTHVPLVKYAPTLDQQMNSSSLQTAACENVFQTEQGKYLPRPSKKKKGSKRLLLPYCVTLSQGYGNTFSRKQQWSSHTLQAGLFLCDSPSLPFVCQSS